MDMERLKVGLWGYQKKSVYRYIARMNERYAESIALLQKEKETAENAVQILSEEKSALERLLEEQRKENERIRALLAALETKKKPARYAWRFTVDPIFHARKKLRSIRIK